MRYPDIEFYYIVVFADVSSAHVEEAQQVNQQLAVKLGQLQADLEELSHKYQAQVADNAQLSK